MKKKLLIFLLSIFMIFTIAPITVFADDNEAKIGSIEYPTLQDAINAVNNGEEIIVIDDITCGNPITITTDGSIMDTLDMLKEKTEKGPSDTNVEVDKEQIEQEIQEGIRDVDDNSISKLESSASSQARAAKICESILEIMENLDAKTGTEELKNKLTELEKEEGIEIYIKGLDEIIISFVADGHTYRLMTAEEFIDKLNKIQDTIKAGEQKIFEIRDQILNLTAPLENETLEELSKSLENVKKSALEGIGLYGELRDAMGMETVAGWPSHVGTRYGVTSESEVNRCVTDELIKGRNSLELVELHSNMLLEDIQTLKEDGSPENLTKVKRTLPILGDSVDSNVTASVLSQGNLSIVFGIGGLAVGFLAAMIIFRKKKN